MGDEFAFSLGNQGPSVKRPTTNAGRVAANGRLAQDELEDRQTAGAASSLWPLAAMDDSVFRALPREPALARKSRTFTSGADGLVPIFSVLNGLGHDGKSRAALIEDLSFAGLIGSDGAIYDTKGNYPANPDVALILGGTSTVLNTSKEYIRNGDFVMWDIPDEGSVPSQTSARDRRILVSLKPYRPSEQSVTAEAVKQHMKTPRTARGTPMDGACASLRRFVRVNAIMALQAFLASGLVAYDSQAMGTSDAAREKREANAEAWASLGNREREKHLVRVARALKPGGIRDMDQTAEIRVPSAPGHSDRIGTYLDAMFIGMEKLIAPVEGSHNIPSGDPGALLRAQLGGIDGLLAGVFQAQEHTRSRVIGRAITPAAPGQAFDINLGAYTV